MVKWCIQQDFRIAIYSGFLPFWYKHHEIKPNGCSTALEQEQLCVRLCVVKQQLLFAVPVMYHFPETEAHLLRFGRNQRTGSHQQLCGPSPYHNLSFFLTQEKESSLAPHGGQVQRGGDSLHSISTTPLPGKCH